MANQVVGTGSVEIIFDYEKNLKKTIGDIKKEWSSSKIGDVFSQVEKSMISLNKSADKVINSTKKVTKVQDENQKLIEKAIERTALFADKKYYQMQKSAERSAKESANVYSRLYSEIEKAQERTSILSQKINTKNIKSAKESAQVFIDNFKIEESISKQREIQLNKSIINQQKYIEKKKQSDIKSAKESAQVFIQAEKEYEAEFKKLKEEESALVKKQNQEYEASFKKLQAEESKIENLKLQQKIKVANQIRNEETKLKNSQIKSAKESFNVFIENENRKLAILKQNDVKRLTSNYGNSNSTFNYIPSDFNKSLLNAQKTQQSQTGYGSKSISDELKNTSNAYKEAETIIQNRIKQTEVLKNQELMLSKALQISKGAQKEYISTLQQQVKAGEPLTAQQKERIKLLKEEDTNQRNGALGYGLASYGLQQLGSSMLNVAKSAVVYQAQIEKSLAVTSAVAGSGTEGIQQLEEAMIRMGTDTPVRFQLISDSMYEMASAGLDVQEVLEAMPQALKLAQGVGENLGQTTDLLISTVKSFDMDFSDSKRILDVFANSVAKSQGTIEKLQVSFARVAPVAQNVGVSFEETTAILSKLYDLGLKGSNAGTVLGNVMTRLTTFTDQSTKALEKAGLSTNDVSLEYNSLGESLAKITIAMRENKLGAEQLQHIFGTRGKIITDFLNQLDGENVDELTASYNDLVNSITDASGATDKFYKVQEETTQMTLDRAQNAIDRLKLASGEALKETVQPLVGSFADLANSIADSAENSEVMNVALQGVLITLGGAGGLIELAGKFAMPLLALSSLKNLFAGGVVVTGIMAVAGGLNTIGAVLMSVATGSGLASAGITALGVAGAGATISLAPFIIGLAAVAGAIWGIKKVYDKIKLGKIEKLADEYDLLTNSQSDYAKSNSSYVEAIKKHVSEELKLLESRNLSQEELEEERLRVKAKYAKKLSDVDKGIVEEAQKSQVEKMSQVFFTSKGQYKSWGDYLYDTFSNVAKNSKELATTMAQNTLATMQTVLTMKKALMKDKNLSAGEVKHQYKKEFAEYVKDSKLSPEESKKQTEEYNKNLDILFSSDLNDLESKVEKLKDSIKTGSFEKLKSPSGNPPEDDEEKKKTTTDPAEPQSELELAQKYVSEYFDNINSIIESTLSANVRKLQSDRDVALKGLDENSDEYKRIYAEYSKKEEQLNIQSGLEREKKQKESLDNLNDVNLTIYKKYIENAIKENKNLDTVKFESGISGETFKLYSKENKFEAPNVTGIQKEIESYTGGIKDGLDSSINAFKNINELAEILEKSTDVKVIEDTKKELISSATAINNANESIRMSMEAEFQSKMKSAQSEEERNEVFLRYNKILEDLNKTQKIDIDKLIKDIETKGSALAMSDISGNLLNIYNVNEDTAKLALDNFRNKIVGEVAELKNSLSPEAYAKLADELSSVLSNMDLSKDFETKAKTLNAFTSNILSAKNEKLNSNLEKATTNMNDVFDNFINAVGDTSSLIDSYSEISKGLTSEQRDVFKSQIKKSIDSITGNTSITDYLMRLIDSDINLFKSELQDISIESLASIKSTKQYKDAFAEFSKSKKSIKGNENLTQAELESEFDNKLIESAKAVAKSSEIVENAHEKLANKIEKSINSLSSLSSALDQLASTTGSSTLGGIATVLSGGLGMATGVQTAIANVGVDAIAGIAGGLSAISAGISLAQTLTDDSDVQADNEKNRQLWQDSLDAIDDVISTLDSNFSSLISYTMDLVENTTPTTSNIAKGQSEIQNIANTMANQNKNFSDVTYASSHSGRRHGKSTTIQRTSRMDLQTLYSELGFAGNVDTTATLSDLQNFTNKLNSLSLNEFNSMFMLDNEGLRHFDLQQANFKQLANEIQAYIDLMEKAQEQAKQFAKLATFSDFTGFEVSDIDELYQSYIDQYTEMGVTITDSIKDYLYALAEDNAITETITADVRDGFVSGWSQGQSAIESLSSSLETYFSGIMENLSKVYYDTVLDTFNTTLSEFYVNYMEALADIKTASGDITDFATSYDYSSILTAISDAQDLENTLSQVYATIREQAESAGISGVLIDEMLGDEYRLTIRDNISSAVSSGIMDGFNDGDITETDIKNSIFSTIVEQAMTDIIDNIMSKNGVTSIVTQIVDALQSGDTAVLESLGISLTDSINAGLDESSATIEYLMGLLDKYSGENTDPIVFFDESNLESIQQSMKDYQDFSIQTKGLSSSVETTKRIEITISASGSLTDVELKAIAQQISEEVGLEVSTSKYI